MTTAKPKPKPRRLPLHDRPAYMLTLVPTPAGYDRLGRLPSYRLQIALKRLLRDTGFRCTAIDQRGQPDELAVATKGQPTSKDAKA